MAYLKAVIGAVVVGLLLGVGVGTYDVLAGAIERLRPEDKAVVFAMSISEAMNCGAFFVLLLVPLTVVVVFAKRRWRRHPRAG